MDTNRHPPGRKLILPMTREAIIMASMTEPTDLARFRTRLAEMHEAISALGKTRDDDGSYGYCVACDEPIDPQRLELDPVTSLRKEAAE